LLETTAKLKNLTARHIFWIISSFSLTVNSLKNYRSNPPVTQSNSVCQLRSGQLHPGLVG